MMNNEQRKDAVSANTHTNCVVVAFSH